MTGNLSMGSHYITDLITGGLGSDAVNRTFVLGQGFITSTFNATYDAKWGGTNYNASYLTSTLNSTYDATTTLVNGNLNNWNATYNSTYDAKPSSTFNSTYDATTTKVNGNLANWNATYNSTYDATTTLVNGNLNNWNATFNATYDAKVSTSNTSYVLVDGSRSFTGSQSMGSNRLTSVGAPTTAGDALIYQAWAAWSPTLTWGGATPGSVQTQARWTQTGKTVNYVFNTYSADSNGATGMSFTLPQSAVTMRTVSFAGWEYNGGASPLSTNPFPYIDTAGTPGSVQFWLFRTGIDGQWIELTVSGSYEVA
jgi:hypothetical protein